MIKHYIFIIKDQPAVAYRVGDELGLGIRLETKKLSFQEIRSAAHKIFADHAYYDRVKRLAEISKTHNGVENANKIILDFLNKKNK